MGMVMFIEIFLLGLLEDFKIVFFFNGLNGGRRFLGFGGYIIKFLIYYGKFIYVNDGCNVVIVIVYYDGRVSVNVVLSYFVGYGGYFFVGGLVGRFGFVGGIGLVGLGLVGSLGLIGYVFFLVYGYGN